MWTSLRNLGFLSIALVLGTGVASAGDLSNVTVGRFQDFTVVTLFGAGPLSVTHQIVEAKDGKPHRIVVDVTGAVHRLPQNNYTELPEGSITAIRTSQFAVSPEPVVRVVLDLAHQATYRLESPEGEVRLLVSLPGDPPMATTWSAREGALPVTGQTEQAVLAEAESTSQAGTTDVPAPQEQALAAAEPAATATTLDPAAGENASQNTSAQAEPPAAETTSENAVDAAAGKTTEQKSAPAEAQPTPGSTEPTAQPGLEGEAKALPLAPAGAMAVTEGVSGEASPAPAVTDSPSPAQSAREESASSGNSLATSEPTAAEQNQAATEHASQSPEPAAAGAAALTTESNVPATDEPSTTSQALSDEQPTHEVPLPDASKDQPERVIDYNLPLPASLAELGQSVTETPSVQPELESAPETEAPEMAVQSAPEGEAVPSPAADEPVVSGTDATSTDAASTDVGSAPLASLSTLPPIAESADALVPDREQIIYHTHGRRDPFKALLTAGGYSASALPDVATLRLVGILQDVMESWGLFEDANGYGYILRKGDRVKNGTVTQLTNNRAYFNLTEFGWSRSVHIDLEPEG